MVDKYKQVASSIDPNRESLRYNIVEWAHQVLSGKFYLKGNNPITKFGLWPLIQRTCSENGWCLLVKAAEDVFRVADIKNLTINDAGEIEKAEATWINPLGGMKIGGGTEEGFELTDEKEFALALNTFDKQPNLINSMSCLKYLDAIYRSMIFDLEVSRPRLFIKTRFYANEVQKDKIKQNIDAYNMIVYASLGNGQPMEFMEWKPESKHESLRNKWENQFSLFRRLSGIVHNTSKKEARHNVAEVEMVEEQFESFEILWQQEREKFLRDCYEKFGGEEYTLMLDGEEVFWIGDKFVEEEEQTEQQQSPQDKENVKVENKKKTKAKKEKGTNEELKNDVKNK